MTTLTNAVNQAKDAIEGLNEGNPSKKYTGVIIKDLVEGYEASDWGTALVTNDAEYYQYLFYDYDYVSAPIYLFPFTPNILSTGGFTNGYGFAQQ